MTDAQVDWERREWKTIVKGGKEHRVPLSSFAMDVVEGLPSQANKSRTWMSNCR